jgi:hypothetical protein
VAGKDAHEESDSEEEKEESGVEDSENGRKYSTTEAIVDEIIGPLSLAVTVSGFLMMILGQIIRDLSSANKSCFYGAASFLVSHSFDTSFYRKSMRFRWWIPVSAFFVFYALTIYFLYAIISVNASWLWVTAYLLIVSVMREFAGMFLYSNLDDPRVPKIYARRAAGVVAWILLVATSCRLWTTADWLQPVVYGVLLLTSPLSRMVALWQGGAKSNELDAQVLACLDFDTLLCVLPLSLVEFSDLQVYLVARALIQWLYCSSIVTIITGAWSGVLASILIWLAHDSGGKVAGPKMPVRFNFICVLSAVVIFLRLASVRKEGSFVMTKAPMECGWNLCRHCICVSCGYAGLALLLAP